MSTINADNYTGPTEVDFHFDVMCPWAYQTSMWMRDVRDRLGLQVNWKFFSLEEVNLREGKKHPWERDWSYGWSMMRIGAILRRDSMDLLDKWYATSGRALHVDGNRPHNPDVARHLLEQIGADPDIVDVSISDETTHDEIKAEHQRVVDSGGFGVPTLFFDDQAIFGPVLLEPPTGDAALRMWDLVVGWLEFPRLYEVQRPKMEDDERAIYETFKPYLEARDWVSINRGKEVGFESQAAG
ncbi:DsbA family protein [Candidatus Poriferisodalis sp.]|uniref:mycothiol-dependent nitroreductase Rv2466c family protein n=1 Tax=Candidatus Poriferisodalis sp. TaxID=3101277 RepID=UPI003B5C5CE3